MILYLKEHRQVALHVACGDITDVQIEGGKLKINVNENMIFSLLVQNRLEIERALRWQGLDLDIEINFKELEKPKEEQDISKLKDIFEDVTVLEKKQIWR